MALIKGRLKPCFRVSDDLFTFASIKCFYFFARKHSRCCVVASHAPKKSLNQKSTNQRYSEPHRKPSNLKKPSNMVAPVFCLFNADTKLIS